MLPARASSSDHEVRFEQVLHKGLAVLKDEYDYIIIDTAPTLSYLTINAIFAADGVIVPVRAGHVVVCIHGSILALICRFDQRHESIR